MSRMQTSYSAATLAMALLFALANVASAQQPAGHAADEAAIHQAGNDYLAAMEKGDAKAIADFWTADGTYTDEHGEAMKAREMAQKTFTGAKSARPQIKVSNAAVRFLTNDVALEEGNCETSSPNGGAPVAGCFTALWVKQNGKWKLDSLRETRTQAAAAPTAPNVAAEMAVLEPLVGQWSGTAGKLTMQCTARWNPTKTYIRRDLTVSSDGKQVFSGVQQIGWDPISQSIKSWTFNDDGSYSDGMWSIDGRSWIVMTSGVLPDGQMSSNTQLFKFTDKNTLVWKLLDGKAGGQVTPDMEFKLTRKAAGK